MTEPRPQQRDCRHEPTFPAHRDRLLVCAAGADLIVHHRCVECWVESPHRIDACGWHRKREAT